MERIGNRFAKNEKILNFSGHWSQKIIFLKISQAHGTEQLASRLVLVAFY
jgi:hypothetical protein